MRRLGIAAVLLLAAGAHAAETAAFLDAGAGARADGLAGACVALADDFGAVYWNPAGLARLETRELGASHAELAQNMRLDFLAYAHPTRLGAFAGALTYLSQDAIEGRDAAGHPTASFTASDAAGAVAFARGTDWVDAGVAVKLIQSHIASAQATSAALDLGLRRAVDGAGPGRVILGAAARNLGPGMKFESETNDLPTRLSAGVAYRLPQGHALEVDVIDAPRVGGFDAAVGVEWRARPGAALRLGWTTRGVAGGSGLQAAQGLGMGVGLSGARWGFDYGLRAAGELGLDHRFDLRARF